MGFLSGLEKVNHFVLARCTSAAVLLKRVKVAVDISPTIGDHRVRGIGTYTEQLVSQFKKGKWQIDFDFFKDPKSPPPTDIIHHPYFDLFFHTLPIRKTALRVVTIHDVIPLLFPKYFPRGIKGNIDLFLQKKALKNVDAVICDSQTSRRDIVAQLSFPNDKIHVVYLAAGQNFKKITSRQSLGKVAKEFKLFSKFVLYVGDVNWHKNIETLLQAVKIARVNLVLVGSAFQNKYLPQTVSIDQKINKLGLYHRIIKTGYVQQKELVTLYNLAHVTLLPSFYEGFGLPVLESMACGTPVICSKVASLSEIGGKVAIFCDPKDPKEIAAKINFVFHFKKDQREKLSYDCQKHASAFSWEKVASQTISIYKSVPKSSDATIP